MDIRISVYSLERLISLDGSCTHKQTWPSLVSQHNSCPAEALGRSSGRWRWCNVLSPDTCCADSKLDLNAGVLGRVEWFLLHLTLLLWHHWKKQPARCSRRDLQGPPGPSIHLPSVCRCFPVWHQSLNYDSASQVVPYGSRMNEWSLSSAPSHLWVLWIIWELVTENQFLYLGLMDHWMAWDTVTSGRLYRDSVACKTKILLVEQRLKKKKVKIIRCIIKCAKQEGFSLALSASHFLRMVNNCLICKSWHPLQCSPEKDGPAGKGGCWTALTTSPPSSLSLYPHLVPMTGCSAALQYCPSLLPCFSKLPDRFLFVFTFIETFLALGL